MFRIIQDPSSGGHHQILAKVFTGCLCALSAVWKRTTVLFHTADSAHKQVPLCSHNADYMDSLHEPVKYFSKDLMMAP
jgi:hypothetical protein